MNTPPTLPDGSSRITVKVKADYLERLAARAKPMEAIQELIWNAVDADATKVKVSIDLNGLSAIDRIVVEDNGHGIRYSDSEDVFESLGGSKKKTQRLSSEKKRQMHGQAGKGRFKTFCIGSKVTWTTTFRSEDSQRTYSICGERASLGTFLRGPISQTDKRSGTRVEITQINKNFRSLQGKSAIQQITECFALYLRKYPDVQIIYDGKKINPASVQSAATDLELPPIEFNGVQHPVSMTIIEWKVKSDRQLLFCDENGTTLITLPTGLRPTGFNFTSYIKSSVVKVLESEDLLSVDELCPQIAELKTNARRQLREHFSKRKASLGQDVVETWKIEKVYPFAGTPSNVIEEAERRVFDVVALSLHDYLPDFENADPKSKKFALRLLKHALEEKPSDVSKILHEVLELPKAKQEEFANLLNRTSLSAIINTAKLIADRLDFLKGLETILFDPNFRKHLKERSELHRILVDNTWIFGEEFNLTVDDQSLNEVLKRHSSLLKRDLDAGDVDYDLDVVDLNGKRGIVDLMLSRSIPKEGGKQVEHLVVELKRPSQSINDQVMIQVRNYAFAVAEDERFKHTGITWRFIAISNRMTKPIDKQVNNQRNRPQGQYLEQDEYRLTVWAFTWGQIIESARARLRYLEEHLKYAATMDDGLAYLKAKYPEYVPDIDRAVTPSKDSGLEDHRDMSNDLPALSDRILSLQDTQLLEDVRSTRQTPTILPPTVPIVPSIALLPGPTNPSTPNEFKDPLLDEDIPR